MNMNFFKLQVFVAATETMSFTKAAEKLFISQSAVSKSIQDTEAELNVTLLERKGNLFTVNSSGEVFLQYARQILQQYNALKFEIAQGAIAKDSVLKIGFDNNRTQEILDDLLIALQQKFEGLRLFVIKKNSFEIEKMLLERTLDIGIVSSVAKRQDIRYVPLSTDQILLVCCKSHPLSTEQKYSLGELARSSFALRERGSGTQQTVEQFLKESGVVADLNIKLETQDDRLIFHFLLHSHSLTFMSEDALNGSEYKEDLKVIPLKEGIITRRTYLAYTSEFSGNPILKAVLKLISEKHF